MSGINSIVGINQVGVDYRPEPGQVENTGKSAVGGEPQKLEVVNDVGSILRRMDVLLMNAAQRSVTTNIENQVRHALAAKVGNKKNSADLRTLEELEVLTEEELEDIQQMATNAATKLRALDKFSGSDLALAVGNNRLAGGVFGWRKASNGELTSVAAAVKEAVDAQNDLSDRMHVLCRRLARNDNVDAETYDKFVEFQLLCDRRGTEINSIVLRMHELAMEDVKSGGRSDPRIKELMKASFQELMPREAIMMHGTADALELMRKSIDEQISPLLEKLDTFRDHAKVLTKQDLLDLQSYMTTAREAIREVAKNGIVIDDVKYDIDKSLLQKLEEVIDLACAKLDVAFSTYRENMLAAFCAEVKATLLPEGPGKDKLEASSANSQLGKYVAFVNDFVSELSSSSYGADDAEDDFLARIDQLIDQAYDVGLKSHLPFMQKGYDETTATKMFRAFNNLTIIAAQFADLKKGAYAMQGAGNALVTSGDVRRIMLGELGVSSVVEATARGFKAGDANSDADDANIVESKPLGAGNAASAYIVTTKGNEQYVFKPELEGRIGLSTLTLGRFGAYSEWQSATNLNLATQDVANMLGCGDLVVKYLVGSHKGQFGMFMEKAPGTSARDLQHKVTVNGDGFISPNQLLQVTEEEKQNKIKCQIARQLNRLQWLDVITGQGDRHWNNYFLRIDKDTYDVTLKAIDNDASFPSYRIGVQKYQLSKERAQYFENCLVAACSKIHLNGSYMTEYTRLMKSPAIVKNANGTMTVDLSKIGRAHEIGVALSMAFGMHSLGFPDAIDEDFYNHLIALGNDPKAKKDFLDALKPRLTSRAFEATQMRLDDAIAYAKQMSKDRVFTADDWKSPAKVDTLGTIPRKIKIVNRVNAEVKMNGKMGSEVQTYLLNSCSSYYGRDCMDMLFGKKVKA